MPQNKHRDIFEALRRDILDGKNEGAKTYRYGHLDKVLSVTEGNTRYTYGYHVDGQIATATKSFVGKPTKGGPQSPAAVTTSLWDGLALVRRRRRPCGFSERLRNPRTASPVRR